MKKQQCGLLKQQPSKMNLGEFIKNFSHNNVIRLVYKLDGGHETVLEDWNQVTMDWMIPLQRGKFRHYIDNKVLGLVTIGFDKEVKHPEALNIVIERLENQPFIEEKEDIPYYNTQEKPPK